MLIMNSLNIANEIRFYLQINQKINDKARRRLFG